MMAEARPPGARRGHIDRNIDRMNIHHTAPVPSPKPQVSGERGTLLATLVHLWPYIWPSDRADLKLRVGGALVLLLFAKLATLAGPFTFKWATDALAGNAPSGVPHGSCLPRAPAAPRAETITSRGARLLLRA